MTLDLKRRGQLAIFDGKRLIKNGVTLDALTRRHGSVHSGDRRLTAWITDGSPLEA